MSVFWWILIAYVVWALAGFIRLITLLGHKNHKDTLLDKILITGMLPIAYLFGVITNIRRKLRK